MRKKEIFVKNFDTHLPVVLCDRFLYRGGSQSLSHYRAPTISEYSHSIVHSTNSPWWFMSGFP